MHRSSRYPFSNIPKIKTGNNQRGRTNRAKLDQTCLAALIIQCVQASIASGKASYWREEPSDTREIARSVFFPRPVICLACTCTPVVLPLCPVDMSLSVPLPFLHPVPPYPIPSLIFPILPAVTRDRNCSERGTVITSGKNWSVSGDEADGCAWWALGWLKRERERGGRDNVISKVV